MHLQKKTKYEIFRDANCMTRRTHLFVMILITICYNVINKLNFTKAGISYIIIKDEILVKLYKTNRR